MGKKSVTIIAAWITFAAIIIGAIITGAFLYFNSNNVADQGELESKKSGNNSTEFRTGSKTDNSFSTGRYAPSNIFKAIADVPLLHQAKVKKDFIGTQVKWKGTLFALDRAPDYTYGSIEDSNLVYLNMIVDKKLITCLVNLKNYSNLGLLRKGDTIIIEGKIGNIRDLSIGIADPKLTY